jgi:hypothetical protein
MKKWNASARSLSKCRRGRCFGSVSWTLSERGGIRLIRVGTALEAWNRVVRQHALELTEFAAMF